MERYSKLDVDCIAGLDARGFVLGPPIALALKKPFIMIRKKGKLPNSISGSQYYKEYHGDNATGGDELCVSRTANFTPNNRVLVIDDLVATGGTLIAACDLLSQTGFQVSICNIDPVNICRQSQYVNMCVSICFKVLCFLFVHLFSSI